VEEQSPDNPLPKPKQNPMPRSRGGGTLMKAKLEQTSDLRKGRTVLLNIRELECQKGNYAEVLFFSDLHYGHPTCLLERAKETLDWALENRVYVMLLGDLIECGLTGSVGDSIYTQRLNPQGQFDDMVDILDPLAKAGLILGLHSGNHEDRIFKTSGVNISKMLAGTLRVPFLGSAVWNLFRVGKQNYKVYTLHGSSGSKFIYTKIKAATDISHYFPTADLICHAHIHDLGSIALERQDISLKDKQVIYRKQYILLTGGYLGYKQSYAEAKGLPPAKIGSPKVKFIATEHDLHVRT